MYWWVHTCDGEVVHMRVYTPVPDLKKTAQTEDMKENACVAELQKSAKQIIYGKYIRATLQN